MSVKARPVMSAVASFVAGCALAGDAIHFIGTATSATSATASDISNYKKWGNKTDPLSPENDYIVDNGKWCGSGGEYAFPGKSLTLGVVDGNDGNLSILTSGGTFDFKSLVLNKGKIYSNVGASCVVQGGIAVNASSDSPFAIYFNGTFGGNYSFDGDVSGSGHLRVYKASQSGNYDYLVVRFRGDMGEFAGTLELGQRVGNDNKATVTTYRTPVFIGDTAIGGSLVLNACGEVGPCGTGTDGYGLFSTENLSLANGSAFRIGINATTGGTVRVTRELTLPEEGKVYIDVRNLPDACTAVRRHPVLFAPAGSGLTTNKFQLCALNTAEGTRAPLHGRLAGCSLEVDSSGSGEVLYLVLGKYTYKTAKDSWGESSWLPEYANRWSGFSAGTALDPETTYIAFDSTYIRSVISPPDSSTFPGKRLVLANSNTQIQFAGSARIDDFVMLNGTRALMHNKSGFHLTGCLALPDPNDTGSSVANLRTGLGRSASIESTISGSGGLKLSGETDGGSDSSCTFYLQGVNTAFSGKLSVSNAGNNPVTNTTLRISDVRSLGGPMAAFAYNGIAFANWSRFRADASLTLSEPTRGVYFSGSNYVNIANAAHTLTLASQTTLAGTLVKEGSGTLALGGTLKFTSSQSDTPAEGTNILQVSAGRVKPVSKTGADGLAITFASGTGLRLAPLAEADADVLRYGLYDVKWATPFDLTATGGKLDVAFDLPQDMSGAPNRFSFGVCTVPSSFAPAVVGNIVLPSVRGYRHSVAVIDNGDGTATFKATYAKIGFVVSIR